MEHATSSRPRTPGPSRPTRPEGLAEEKPSVDGLAGWLAGRLPDPWFEAAPSVVVDRDEILIVGRLSRPRCPTGPTRCPWRRPRPVG